MNFKHIAVKELSKELREIRRQKKLTLQQVSAAANLPVDTIDLIELGRSVAFYKYKRLIDCYHKKIEIRLVD